MKISKLLFAIIALCLFMCNVVCSSAVQKEEDLLGKAAPAFKLPAHTGGEIALNDFKDKKVVVLAFYPKDFTGG